MADSLPRQVVQSTTIDITIKSAVGGFHPRAEEYRAAGLSDDIMKEQANRAEYQIPEHQRFFVWKPDKESHFLDSIFQGFPIPSLITTDTDMRGLHHIEDGQQRLTCLWRFYHNQFAYIPSHLVGQLDPPHFYYSAIPAKAPTNSHVLPEHQQHLLDTTRLSFQHVKIQTSSIHNPENIKAEIFERLNSNEPLKEGDKIWNRRQSPAIKSMFQIFADGTKSQPGPVANALQNIFGWNVHNLVSGTHKTLRGKPLCILTALFLGLSTDSERDKWSNVMGMSFGRVHSFLSDTIHNESQIRAGILSICNVLTNAEKRGVALTTSDHTSLTRHVPVMIYDFRMRLRTNGISHTEEVAPNSEIITEFINFWMRIIGYLQSSPYTTSKTQIDRHPIKNLYTAEDRARNGTGGATCAQWYQTRYIQVLQHNEEWLPDHQWGDANAAIPSL